MDTFSPRGLARFVCWLTFMSCCVGCLGAGFSFLLLQVTLCRFQFPHLIYAMPLAGGLSFLIYRRFSPDSERGVTLVLQSVRETVTSLSWKMSPLIALSTLLSHLTGASVGREGVGVQIGGSMAHHISQWAKMSPFHQRLLIQAGIAAGFAALFGTPFAAMIFAFEAVAFRSLRLVPLFLILLSSCLANFISHWLYPHRLFAPVTVSATQMNYLFLLKLGLCALCFATLGSFFPLLVRAVSHFSKQHIRAAWMRPIIGGILLITLVKLTGNRDFLGLGVIAQNPSELCLEKFFLPETHAPFAWLWKLVFTVIAIGFSFKGGEVTPLFYIGAACGSALAAHLHLPSALISSLGFITVFGCAAKVPLTAAVIGMEMFGLPLYVSLPFAYCAHLISFPGSIYHSPASHEPTP